MTVGITHEVDGSWGVARNVDKFPTEPEYFDTKKEAVAHAKRVAARGEKIIEGRGKVIREGSRSGDRPLDGLDVI